MKQFSVLLGLSTSLLLLDSTAGFTVTTGTTQKLNTEQYLKPLSSCHNNKDDDFRAPIEMPKFSLKESNRRDVLFASSFLSFSSLMASVGGSSMIANAAEKAAKEATAVEETKTTKKSKSKSKKDSVSTVESTAKKSSGSKMSAKTSEKAASSKKKDSKSSKKDAKVAPKKDAKASSKKDSKAKTAQKKPTKKADPKKKKKAAPAKKNKNDKAKAKSKAAPKKVKAAKAAPKNNMANPDGVKNCSSFDTYADAKAWYDKYKDSSYSKVARKLDGNSDGIPCETLSGAPKKIPKKAFK